MAKKKSRQQAKKKKSVDDAAAEAKRARREERKRAEAEAKRKAERARKVRVAALSVATVAALLVAGWFIFQPDPELAGVEKPSFAGAEHVAQGQPVGYDSATPTSGNHDPRSPRCGLTTDEMPRELAVHALEHGAIVIWYRPDLQEELLPDLQNLIDGWDSHVLISPNSAMSDPLVATAWNRLKRYDGFDEELDEFISTYRRRGPESLDCPIA